MHTFHITVLMLMLFPLSSARIASYTRDSCNCPPEIDPVCVREGPHQYSYASKCIFKCAQEKNKELAMLYEGSCCTARYCNMFEPPVCAEDGQMYQSICELEERQCVEYKLYDQHLAIDSNQDKCSCVAPCPQEWNPVCDKNGKTHANFCTFLNSKCFHKNQLNQTIEIDYSGVCCEDMCTSGQTSLTVCDSDGNTHTDICSFYVEKCRQLRRGVIKKRLQIAGVGPCKPKNPLLTTFDFFINRFPNYHPPRYTRGA
ncbi:unnamed protein product [Caenorhabditis bovis]|uniref:Kazal-like domain-containing protein n=1 Tax=Caenorhabditis bovis TaxID=2654633 RepID=A0A8S1EEY4_9PELO|nr:unnamed protein product [Caenorhabditis bovis]